MIVEKKHLLKKEYVNIVVICVINVRIEKYVIHVNMEQSILKNKMLHF